MTKANYQFTEQDGVLTLEIFGKPRLNKEHKKKLMSTIISFCFFYVAAYFWVGGRVIMIDLVLGLFFGQAIYRQIKYQSWLKNGFEKLQINPIEGKLVFFRKLNSVFDINEISFENLKYLGGAERLNYPYNLKTQPGSWLANLDTEGKFCFLFEQWDMLFKHQYIHYFGSFLTNQEIYQIEQRIYQFLVMHQIKLEIA